MVKRLLILNGLAAIGAVAHHAISWDLIATFWWADRYLPVSVPYLEPIWGLRYATLRVIDQFAFSGVFAFLIVSGYFISATATDNQTRVRWALVLRRAKNLLIPYLVWSFIYIAFNLLQDKTYSPLQIIRLLLTGGIAAPYYFVPLLIQLYLLSPLLVPIAKRQPWTLLGIALLLQVPVTMAHYLGILKQTPRGMELIVDVLRNWQLLGYLIWFVIGIVLGLHLQSFKRLISNFRRSLPIALFLASAASIAEWELIRQASGRDWLAIQVTASGKIFALLFFLAFLAYDRLPIPFSDPISRIGTKSYGIYLIHPLLLELIARGVYHVAPWLLAHQVPYILLLCVAGLAVPLLMMRIVDRIQPLRKFYDYLFG